MLDRNSGLPLHTQFENIVLQKIENEEWPANTCIPSENEFSKIYGISRMTVRIVLNRLVDLGLLYRAPGKGTFVAEPKIVSNPLTHRGIREQLEEMGYKISTELISYEELDATSKVARILGIQRGDEILMVKRLRKVKGTPLSYHISYLPKHYFNSFENTDLVNKQMCHIIEKEFKYPIRRRVETLEATTASTEEAWLLSVKPSFPLLLLENIVYTDDDIPLEYTKVIFRGDKIKIKLEYDQ
ncbi:MAG: GntR family transcriptional regulator [Sphaerochaetaceae bacterium]